jgi:hypothetical protein
MKFVVVSDKTIERAIVESSILGDMKSDKQKEKEKLEKERLEKERLEKERLEKENNNKSNDNVGAQGGTNGAQGPQSSNTIKNNDNVGAQGGTNGTQGGTNGTQGSTNGAQGGTNGAQGPQTNTIKKNNEIDQFIRKGKEVTINDFGGIKPSNPSGKVIPKPTKPLMTNSPAAKAGIPLDTRQKFANQNAAFQATKNKDSGYTKMDFIKDFPNSQTAKKYNKGEKIPGFSYKKNLNNSYEPYDLVLDYVLSEGHADTVEEAHYVMMQMDEDTIQTIVEFLGGRPGDGYLGHPNLDIKNPFFRGKRTKGTVLDKSNADKLPDVNVNKVGAQMGDYNIKMKKMIDDI